MDDRFTIYQTETSAVQVNITNRTGALYMDYNIYDQDYKYLWIPESCPVPTHAELISNFTSQNVVDIAVYHNDIDSTKDVLSKLTLIYNESKTTVMWFLDNLEYIQSSFSINNIYYNRVSHIYLPDTAIIRGLFPRDHNTGERATISIDEYVINKSEDAVASFSEDMIPTMSFSLYDPFERVIGIYSNRVNSHINVKVYVPNDLAFYKKFNRGYVCYVIKSYVMDGTLDTSSTYSGTAERRLLKTEKGLISLDDQIAAQTIISEGFNINPRITDPAITNIVIELSAAFWNDDHTSLEDMHTGVLDTNTYYISRDPVALSNKIPLSNGFYDITWDDCMTICMSDATPFLEVPQKYSHVPGPSSLKVYNCIKASDPIDSNTKAGYTLFKIQSNKEQSISTPTSIIVPFNDVICTIGTAALDKIDNQSDKNINNIWTSQN